MSKKGPKGERVLYLTLDLLPKVNDGVSPGIHFILLVWVMRLGLHVGGWLSSVSRY